MGIFNKNKDEQKDDVKVAKTDSVKEVKADKKADKAVAGRGHVVGILVAPLVTERTASLEVLNQYAFIVETSANKSEIAKAVETRYGVKPVSVNISNYQGKSKRRGKTIGRTKKWKKAIITLPKGKAINVYENVK